MDKKVHQRAINKLVREVNKTIEKDDLWCGRFFIQQVRSPKWLVYCDHSGAEYFVHLEFVDRCTGRVQLHAADVNYFRTSFGNGWRLYEIMNDFIVHYCDVWNEPLAKERNYDAWREYNKNVRKVK